MDAIGCGVSATEWAGGSKGSAPVHYYSVKHATSEDGLAWATDDRLCLPYQENEHAIARPVVTPVAGGYNGNGDGKDGFGAAKSG